jgi:hypothetical protein
MIVHTACPSPPINCYNAIEGNGCYVCAEVSRQTTRTYVISH